MLIDGWDWWKHRKGYPKLDRPDNRREHWGFTRQTVQVSAREGRYVLASDDTIAALHPDAEWIMLAPVDLEPGDRLLIDRTDGALTEVRRGDAVLWRKPPAEPEEIRLGWYHTDIMPDGMPIVYVVEVGQYSERYIAAVYDADHRDEAMAHQAPEGWRISVCEYPLNEVVQEYDTQYTVEMERNGDTPERGARVDDDPAWIPDDFLIYRGRNRYALVCRCYARDAKHAIKIANEHRTRIVADGRWPGE